MGLIDAVNLCEKELTGLDFEVFLTFDEGGSPLLDEATDVWIGCSGAFVSSSDCSWTKI